MSTVIRPLRDEDKEPIRQLLVETDVFTEEEVGIALELIGIVLDKPEQQDYIINVYEEGGSVLGYYCIGPTPATLGTFDLYWIAVKPSAQGRGVGRALDLHAEQLVRSKNGRLMVAETSSQPRYEKTRRFYVTHGYSELSRIRDYYRVGDDLVVYGKYLSQSEE
ncbi:MAG: GNAT family N-acetyltransferase [Ignavibacteriae bacterium]|nr:GNAT family N-acetyltransferase [Ignavibacteriota bacterium]